MPFKFFTIPVRQAGTAEAELNGFVQSHKVLAVDRRWVDQGADSFWAVCVDFIDAAPGAAATRNGASRSRVDYKEVLSDEEFAVFAQLRQLRKEIAQHEAVPVYAIFTNEQLAKMIQARVASKGALEQIAGVGDARVEKYGPRVLEFLAGRWSKSIEASGKPV